MSAGQPFGRQAAALRDNRKMGLDRLTPKLQASSNSCLATAARETVRHYVQWDGHVGLTYDPDLRVAFNAAMAAPLPELWPLFDAGEVLPLAVIRGAGSDVLARATVVEMLRRSLDMIHVKSGTAGRFRFWTKRTRSRLS